ncbi:MAG: hypothetical protein ACYC7E_06100 [Armatimonadota bacterium]
MKHLSGCTGNLIMAVVLCLFAFPLRAPAQPTPTEQLFNDANAAMARQNYKGAIPLIQQYLGQAPAGAARSTARCKLARCFVETKQSDLAVKELEGVRQDDPNGAETAEATALLYTLYLGQNAVEKATPLADEVFKRWPKTEAAWTVLEARYRYWMKGKPEQALQGLDEVLQADLLSPAGTARARVLRFEQLRVAKPDQFVTEVLPILNNVGQVRSLNELQFPATLARLAYLPLMQKGHAEEARAIYTQLQAKMAQLFERSEWYKLDAVAYFDALYQANAPRFLPECLPILQAARFADTITELHLAMTIAPRCYGLLMKAGRYDDAKMLSQQLQAAYQRVGYLDSVYTDRREYLRAIAPIDKARFITESLPWIVSAKGAASKADIEARTGVALWLYGPLQQANRPDDARAVHEAMQAALTQYKLSSLLLKDTDFYWRSMGYVPALVLANAPAFLAEASASATPEEARVYAGIAHASLYLRQMQAKKGEDLKRAHAQIQALLTRFDLKDELAADRQAFLVNLAQADPPGFLAEALPAINAAREAKTAAEAEPGIVMARSVYRPFMLSSRLDEAYGVHTQMQQVITRFGNPKNWADEDDKAYRDAVKSLPPAVLDSLFTMFKNTATAGDAAGAQKWLAKLETMAPGHPQTIKARELYTTLAAK